MNEWMSFGRELQYSMLGKAILYIQYLYLNGTHPEVKKKKWKKCAYFRPKKRAIEQLFDLGLAAAVKTKNFHGLYILSLLLVQSSTLPR